MNRNRIILIVIIVLALAAVAFAAIRMGWVSNPAPEADSQVTNFVCEDGAFYAVAFNDDDSITVGDVTYPAAPSEQGTRYATADAAVSYVIDGDSLTAYAAGSDTALATCSSSVTEIPVDSELVPGSADEIAETETETEAEVEAEAAI